MRNALVAVLFVSLVFSVTARSEDYADIHPDWILPTDQAAEGGQIANPTICPADTTWLSYEVWDGDEIRLFIYNTISKEKIRLRSPSPGGSLEGGAGIIPKDRQLAWRPSLGPDNSPWAVFVGNVSGSTDLFLYDVNSKSYSLLQSHSDDQGKGNESYPAWSPDGKILLYCTDINGNSDIYMIRGMDRVLQDPSNKEVPVWHEPKLTKSGNEIAPVWYPVQKSGLFAYTYFDTSKGALSIRVYDSKDSSDREIDAVDNEVDYFGASWDPTGQRLAFYQAKRGEAYLKAKKANESFRYSIGLARISYNEKIDSFIVSQVTGGKGLVQRSLLDVASNNDNFRGPAWLPNGRFLLISSFDENLQNPFRIIDTKSWEDGAVRSSEWMNGFAKDQFKFPSDELSIRNNLTFSYRSQQTRNLLIGLLESRDTSAVSWPGLARKRFDWYHPFSDREAPCRFPSPCWFYHPVFHPDFGLNKRGSVLLIAGWAVCCLAGGCGCGGGKESVRDWGPPILEKRGTTRFHLSLEVSFR